MSARAPTSVRAALALLAFGLPAAVTEIASAAVKTDTASKGQVTATLSYERKGQLFKNVRVRVTRAGALLVDEPGPGASGECGDRCAFGPRFAFVGAPSIFLPELDGDAEPEVLADFYTGGANCCAFSRIYDYSPGVGSYVRIERNWGTGNYRGARDLDGDGVAELESSDPRFKYRFGCGACTPEPLRIFHLRAGELVNVTRRFPKAVKRDLRLRLKDYRRVGRDRFAARGFLAAIVADRYLLGHRRAARRTLRGALRRGELRGARGDGVPDGGAYVRALLRFLRRTGYR